VQNAYDGNATPIQFSTSGNKVLLETSSQRVNDGTEFYGTAWCFTSDVGPSPDASVTIDGNEADDAAAISLAISRIISGSPCSS